MAENWLECYLFFDKDDLKLADSDQGIISYSLQTVPDIPIYDIDGNYSSIVREGYTSPNPIAMAMMDQILLDRQKLTGSILQMLL